MPIQLIVGLGNPGAEYENTRHNAGAWFAENLAKQYNISLHFEKKMNGIVGKGEINNQTCYILIPTTYMNESGNAVSILAKFYKIEPKNILVAHDELDHDPGTARLKLGGGHGGHNGLKSIFSHLGTQDFWRLRLGIGHPKDKNIVADYVLHRPSIDDRNRIDVAIDNALRVMPDILSDKTEKAMNELHQKN